MMGLDLATLNQSVTKLRAEIPEDAFTAGILGSQRIGNGVDHRYPWSLVLT